MRQRWRRRRGCSPLADRPRLAWQSLLRQAIFRGPFDFRPLHRQSQCLQYDERLEVWSHSQSIFNLRRDLALAFGIEPAAVLVHHVPRAGRRYGHNGAEVAYAAWLARAEKGSVVRVLWSRADELSHSPLGRDDGLRSAFARRR